jgi:hypothetical protein
LSSDEVDELRRALVVRALAAGVFAAGTSLISSRARAQLFDLGGRPLPEGRSFHKIEGSVRVNGKPANLSTPVEAGDLVETGARSSAVFAVGTSAYILRENARLQLQGESRAVRVLRLITGGLLSVFGRSAPRLVTRTATIGIRGTGVYLESEPDRTYVCTCYGSAELASTTDPASSEQVVSTHHDAPRYILAEGATGERIRQAPVKNHTDVELVLIESLVGRAPPFPFQFEAYDRPRRGRY